MCERAGDRGRNRFQVAQLSIKRDKRREWTGPSLLFVCVCLLLGSYRPGARATENAPGICGMCNFRLQRSTVALPPGIGLPSDDETGQPNGAANGLSAQRNISLPVDDIIGLTVHAVANPQPPPPPTHPQRRTHVIIPSIAADV